jgi:hypothetical protein
MKNKDCQRKICAVLIGFTILSWGNVTWAQNTVAPPTPSATDTKPPIFEIKTPVIFEDLVYPGSTAVGSGGTVMPKNATGDMESSLELTTNARFPDVWKFYGKLLGVTVRNDYDIDIDKHPGTGERFGTNGVMDGHHCLASAYLTGDAQEGVFLQDAGFYSLSVFITHGRNKSVTYILLQAVKN